MNSTETSSTSGASLQQQLNSLRRMFIITLAILLLLAITLDLYLARQVASIRRAYETEAAGVEQYNRVELPNINKFIKNLEEYSKTHPDIVPILVKHRVISGTNTPAGPAK